MVKIDVFTTQFCCIGDIEVKHVILTSQKMEKSEMVCYMNSSSFSCVLEVFLYIMLYRNNIEIILVLDTGFWISTVLRDSYE